MLWKALTQRAKAVLTLLAQEEAKRRHAVQLLPEHIVLALLRDGGGVAAMALTGLRVDIKGICRDIERSVPMAEGGVILRDVEISERAIAVLKGAVAESRNMGQSYVGTGHLLLAAVGEEAGAFHHCLAPYDISTQQLVDAVLAVDPEADEGWTIRA
jgi:ATP-dependent Clp protease ATP-binding subunit ClpC